MGEGEKNDSSAAGAAPFAPVQAAPAATRVASCVKRGRWSDKPYVPVVVHRNSSGFPKQWTQQIKPFAFATQAAAKAYAQKFIDVNDAALLLRQLSLAARMQFYWERAQRERVTPRCDDMLSRADWLLNCHVGCLTPHARAALSKSGA